MCLNYVTPVHSGEYASRSLLWQAISCRFGVRVCSYMLACVMDDTGGWQDRGMLSWGRTRRELAGEKVISRKQLADIKWMCNCASARQILWTRHRQREQHYNLTRLTKYVFLSLSLSIPFFSICLLVFFTFVDFSRLS